MRKSRRASRRRSPIRRSPRRSPIRRSPRRSPRRTSRRRSRRRRSPRRSPRRTSRRRSRRRRSGRQFSFGNVARPAMYSTETRKGMLKQVNMTGPFMKQRTNGFNAGKKKRFQRVSQLGAKRMKKSKSLSPEEQVATHILENQKARKKFLGSNANVAKFGFLRAVYDALVSALHSGVQLIPAPARQLIIRHTNMGVEIIRNAPTHWLNVLANMLTFAAVMGGDWQIYLSTAAGRAMITGVFVERRYTVEFINMLIAASIIGVAYTDVLSFIPNLVNEFGWSAAVEERVHQEILSMIDSIRNIDFMVWRATGRTISQIGTSLSVVALRQLIYNIYRFTGTTERLVHMLEHA